MRILIVINQYNEGNNVTTMSAIRFVDALKSQGHDVCITSGHTSVNKYVVKKLPLTPFISHIVNSQEMCFAIPNKKTLKNIF